MTNINDDFDSLDFSVSNPNMIERYMPKQRPKKGGKNLKKFKDRESSKRYS